MKGGMDMKISRRKWKALTALGLSAAIAFALPGVAMAAGLTKTGTTNKTEKITYGYDDTATESVSEQKTSENLTNDFSAQTEFEENSTFTISIPKVTTLSNVSSSDRKLTGTMTCNVKCDLAPTQTLDITVADSEIKNQNGLGSQTHSITATMNNITYESTDTFKSSVTGSKKLSISRNTDSNNSEIKNNGALIEGDGKSFDVGLSTSEAVRAGKWRGVIIFTVDLNGEPDKYTFPSTSTP